MSVYIQYLVLNAKNWEKGIWGTERGGFYARDDVTSSSARKLIKSRNDAVGREGEEEEGTFYPNISFDPENVWENYAVISK